MSEDNVFQLKKPETKRIGITFSFLLECDIKEMLAAQQEIDELGKCITAAAKKYFPQVKHTLTSRQEYEP